MSFLFRKICFSILLLFHLQIYSTKASFGDYEDLSFQCPALTTCPIVCVADANDCPWSLTCQDGGNLCSDGSCSENCDDSVASPCLASCAPVACAKNVEHYDQCLVGVLITNGGHQSKGPLNSFYIQRSRRVAFGYRLHIVKRCLELFFIYQQCLQFLACKHC